MLEVKPTLVSVTIPSGQNGNEAVAGADSETLPMWLHHRYAPSNCRRWEGGHIAIPCLAYAREASVVAVDYSKPSA